MNTQNHTLLYKLELFIKKYYQNQLLKGAILGISLLLIGFFTLAFIEYFARFSPTARTTLFFLYLGGCIGVLAWYIVRPMLGLFNISRKFGIKEASSMVGNHFPDVGDKLINTLQLQHEAKSQQDSALLIASIEQKTKELRPVQFGNAISYKTNLRYVKLALIPALALLFILLVSPGFKHSGNRVVNYSKHFEIEAPFDFIPNLQDSNHAVQNEDVDIKLKLSGDEIPNDAYVHFGGQRYKMRKDEVGKFSFQLKNIQRSELVYFESAGFTSKEYPIDVFLKPSLLGYTAIIKYPNYLNLESETVKNSTEIQHPDRLRNHMEVCNPKCERNRGTGSR